MHSSIAIDIDAPPDLVFGLARDVERWADLLPHYARSTARERRPDGTLVADFIARRPFVPILGLGLPVAWRSRTWSEPDGRRLRFVHVAGATRGMDVTWHIEPTADRLPRPDRARVRAAAPRAGQGRRPLVHAADRRTDARDVQGDRRGRGDADVRRRARMRASPADRNVGGRPMTTARRRVWITGIGIITAAGTGVDAFRAGLRRGRVAGDAHRPLRPEPVPLAGRRPGRRLRPARVDAAEDRAAARPVQPVRARGRPAGARGRAAGRREPPARPPTRSASASTSARRWAASPTPRSSTSATSRRGSARSPRTSPSPSSAARPRPTSGSRSTSAARSSRPRTRARRVRSRSARPSATSARDGSTPPSPAAARSR